jgi:arylformamidase
VRIIRRIAALAALSVCVLFAAGAAPLPPRPTPAAALAVFVHGGGWIAGAPDMGDPMSGFFTLRRFLFRSIDYAKPPAVPLSVSVADVARQVQSAARAGPTTLIGHSAGAHLAATAAFRPGAPLVRCLILLDGIGYDLVQLLRDNPPIAVRLQLDWREAATFSPQALVATSHRRPAVMLAAGGDARGTADQARAFAKVLRAEGVDVTVRLFPEATHNELRTDFLNPASPLSKAVAGFLALHPGCTSVVAP